MNDNSKKSNKKKTRSQGHKNKIKPISQVQSSNESPKNKKNPKKHKNFIHTLFILFQNIHQTNQHQTQEKIK
jgi:hypothetical protein